MERKRGQQSVLKSTGATVLSGPKSLAGDPRPSPSVSKPNLPEAGLPAAKSPTPAEGRARSSSRPLVELKERGSASSARPEPMALPGVPSGNDGPGDQLSHSASGQPVTAAPAPARRGPAPATQTEDDLDALLKGLDEPSTAPAAPAAASPPAAAASAAAAPAASAAGKAECCTSCGKNFEAGQNIYESSISGAKQILCSGCWAKVAPHCIACGEEISGTMAKVGDDIYHQDCLKCTQCRKPIDGQLTKMECGLVCGFCSKEIEREIQELRSLLAQGDETGAALIIGGLKGRGINPPEATQSDLGSCSTCQRGFKAGQQVYESPDGKTLCESCYLSSAPKCAACLMPVVGTVARVAENAFHPECLVCGNCKQKLTGAFVKTDTGFLCSDCRK